MKPERRSWSRRVIATAEARHPERDEALSRLCDTLRDDWADWDPLPTINVYCQTFEGGDGPIWLWVATVRVTKTITL